MIEIFINCDVKVYLLHLNIADPFKITFVRSTIFEFIKIILP